MRYLICAVALMATVAAAGDTPRLPSDAQMALEPAIAAGVARFNAAEERLRDAPKVERSGPASEPYLLRATYRRAGQAYDVLAIEGGSNPVASVRVRATEFEKRVTNVNGGDLQAALAKAAWVETPRGYVLDFRFRWTGQDWEQLGEPAAHPTLGVVGRSGAEKVLKAPGVTVDTGE